MDHQNICHFFPLILASQGFNRSWYEWDDTKKMCNNSIIGQDTHAWFPPSVGGLYVDSHLKKHISTEAGFFEEKCAHRGACLDSPKVYFNYKTILTEPTKPYNSLVER